MGSAFWKLLSPPAETDLDRYEDELRSDPATLRYWRKHGGGPPWARVGEWHVRYEPLALRAWIEQRSMNGGRDGE
jgi:hypothetical protein